MSIRTNVIPQARSGINAENIQEILDASASVKHATLMGQNQYESPVNFATFFTSLLPCIPRVNFDPQCASGNALRSGMPDWVKLMGFEIDNRFIKTDDKVFRVIGNCVTSYEILEDLGGPEKVNLECQCANPPFGMAWEFEGKRYDSTEFTWKMIQRYAAVHGYGWFISNWKTIERMGIHNHPDVYLYQKFPMGVWDNCQVEIGVVHWDKHPGRHKKVELLYETLDLNEHRAVVNEIKKYYMDRYQFTHPQYIEREDFLGSTAEIRETFEKIKEIHWEEKQKRPPFNIWLDTEGKWVGMLRTYLSTRFQIKRKITREEIERLAKIDKQHPLTLTTEKETRLLMRNLIDAGVYSIQPEAKAAIESALTEVFKLACPIMPTTDFERVAYAEEEETLECLKTCCVISDTVDPVKRKPDWHFHFIKGKRYELSTNSYSFTEEFIRKKPHLDEAVGRMYTVDHKCVLSGTDRYVQIADESGNCHRFMDRPEKDSKYEHAESMLWDIFVKPEVKTVAETCPADVERNRLALATCEMLAEYTYYPGQLDYLARVGVKDQGIVAGAVGTGKSLMAISLIQMKGPNRALIIAPQATIRADEGAEEEDEEKEAPEYHASQWVSELRKFAPGLPVFQLFNLADYIRIIKANHGVLPNGVFISYYEAMFTNGARESCPDSWDDQRLALECRRYLGVNKGEFPQTEGDDDTRWCASIGEEHDGVRCIVAPCLATQIGYEFDMVCLDEAHKCANMATTVTQMLIRLQPKYRYAFTATPIPNVVSNLFSIMGWICVEGWYKGNRRNAAWPYARDEIARFTGTFQSVERDITQERMNLDAAIKDERRYKPTKCIKISPIISAPARLLRILKPSMAYISKEMCNPSYKPAKVIDVRVPFGLQQENLYVHFMNRANIPCKNPLIRARKQIAYLRGICADPHGFEHGGPRVKSNFNPKTATILELARDIIRKGDPLVIVCSRVGQTNTLHTALRDAGVLVSRIDSTIPAAHQSYQSNLFKSGKTQVQLFGTRCAAGHSFSECPYMIIGSIEFSPGPLDQTKGRIDRVNSKYDRTIYCVLHKHSLEETMFDTVATKDDAAQICLRGMRVPRNFKPVDMGEVLAESFEHFKSIGVDETKCESQWPALRATFKV